MLKLTDNHYINPDRIAHVEVYPAGQRSNNASFYAVFVGQNSDPIELIGAQAEEAAANWTKYHGGGK